MTTRSTLLGEIEYVERELIQGWVRNPVAPDQPPRIAVFEERRKIDEFPASRLRRDLTVPGNDDPRFGFSYRFRSNYLDGVPRRFHFRVGGVELENSPVTIRAVEEHELIPFATTDLTGNRVLVLAPHADDESLACGGSIIRHRDFGDPVKVLVLTDGARGNPDADCPSEVFIAVREAEALRACAELGVSDVEFWRIPDRELARAGDAVARLVRVLNGYRPTLIYCPSPHEFHPDHRAAAALLRETLVRSRFEAKIALYEYNVPVSVNCLADVTKVVERKKRACERYESQMRSLPHTDFALGLNRYRALTVSPGCEYAEGFLLVTAREFQALPCDVFVSPRDAGTPTVVATPLVSIIVRTRNRPRLLREALRSLSTQTYSNIEVVVVNDGGVDVSATVEEFSSVLTIRYFPLSESGGRTAAANAGLRQARGKYVNFLDDDDLLHSNHVEKLVAVLESTGGDFAYGDCRIGYWKSTNEGSVPLRGRRETLYDLDFDRNRLFLRNYIPIMAAMFSRRLVDRVGLMDEAFEVFEDWDYWIRMAKAVDFHHVPGVTALYRIFEDHAYDRPTWSLKMYRKHLADWFAVGDVAGLPDRLEALENENLELRKRLGRLERLRRFISGLPFPAFLKTLPRRLFRR